MRPTLILHVGLAKTGTTSFQHFCHRNRRALAARGLRYAHSNLGGHRNHAPLAASYLVDRPRDYTIALRVPSRERAVQALRAEIEAAAVPYILVSAEHLAMHFGPVEAKLLAADLAGIDVRVLVTIRDHLARLLSSYNTHVTAGGALHLADYARSVLAPGTRFMSIQAALRIWQEAFGAAAIEIVDYDAEADLVAALLARCGVADTTGLRPEPRHRPSLDASAVRTLRAVNEALIARQGARTRGLASYLQRTAFSILGQRLLGRDAGGSSDDRWHIQEEVLAAVDAVAASDRAWLAEQCHLILRGSPATRRSVAIGAVPAGIADGEAARARTIVDRTTRGVWWASNGLVEVSHRLGQLGRP